MATWTNNDGLVIHYGPRGAIDRPGEVSNDGTDVELIVPVTFDGTLAGPVVSDDSLAKIPARSIVRSSRFRVIDAFAGGTSLAVGTQEADGTEIDNDGLHLASQLTVAALGNKGIVLDGGGADIGATLSTTADAYVKVTATGTFTAGKGEIVITYTPSPGIS